MVLLHIEEKGKWKNDGKRNKVNRNNYAYGEYEKDKNKLKELEESNSQRENDKH